MLPSDVTWLAEQEELKFKSKLLADELKYKAVLEHEASMRDILRDYQKRRREVLDKKRKELVAEITDIDIELDMLRR